MMHLQSTGTPVHYSISSLLLREVSTDGTDFLVLFLFFF